MIDNPRIRAIGLALEREVEAFQVHAGLTGPEVLSALAMATYAYARGQDMSERQVAQWLATFVEEAARCETPAFRAALATPRRTPKE